MVYTMMQVCREADLTYQTLKFYCNEGLIPNVKRDKNNRRIFDERNLKWIKDLDLCLQGESTIPQRKKCWPKSRRLFRTASGSWRTASPTSTGNKISTTMSSPAASLM